MAQCTTSGGAGIDIHVYMHWVPGVLVDHEDAIRAGQVLAKPVDILSEFCIQPDLPRYWAPSKSGQHPVLKQPGWLTALGHVEKLVKNDSELV